LGQVTLQLPTLAVAAWRSNLLHNEVKSSSYFTYIA
jgi:hypothetical protein